MTEMILVGIGFGLLVIAGIAAIAHRHNTSRCISDIMLGILGCTFFMILPTDWGNEDWLHRSLSALLYSFKALGGRQDIKQLYTIVLPENWKAAYITVNDICFALAPVLTSGLVLSGFGDMGERMRYFFRFGKTCHVFSDLNDNALSLAKGIKEKRGLKTVVFCNTKNADKKLAEKARKMGGILLHKKCEDLKLNWRHRHFQFYMIAEDEDANITAAIGAVEKHLRAKAGRLTVNAFAQSGSNINAAESMEKGNVTLRFIDEIALFCNHLLFEHPLYDLPEGKKEISVMLIGCGRCGLQMLKTVVWCGQIEGYSLKIRAYDKEAKSIRKEFYALCPELESKEYDIDFITADVTADDFEKALQDGLDATYVVVATGDDQLNITTADRLRGIFRRRNQAYDNTPPIFARVRAGEKAKNLAHASYLDSRAITLFGNTESIFAERTLFDTKLERLALAVHLSYCGSLEADPRSEAFKKGVRSFETQEYNRRSSMAVALHIPAKLVGCGCMDSKDYELTEEAAASFEKQVDQHLMMLAENEQARWNAFMRSEGWRGADHTFMKGYANLLKDHRDKLAKIHPAITDWEGLEELSKVYNQTRQEVDPSFKPEDFKKSNKDIIKAIPAIIRFGEKE